MSSNNSSNEFTFGEGSDGRTSPIPTKLNLLQRSTSTSYRDSSPIPTKLNVLHNVPASALKLPPMPAFRRAQSAGGGNDSSSSYEDYAESDDDDEGTLLPPEYEVGPNDVVCGRGKGALKRAGNQKLQQLIKSKIDEYSSAKTKIDKSLILSAILDHIQTLSGRFVKKQPNGTWCEIGDRDSIAKIGHAMRVFLRAQRKKKPAAAAKADSSDRDSSERTSDDFERLLEFIADP